MASPFGPLVVIADLRAGRGQVPAELPEIERRLNVRGLQYRIVEVQEPDLAERVATGALEGGERFIVAVGDDRTVHRVVNGMVREDGPIAEDAVLGVVPAGTGADFIRTFGLPEDASRATSILGGDKLFPIDVGRVEYVLPEGGRASRAFANMSQIGFGASVLRRAEGLPRALGRGRYFLSFWRSIVAQKAVEVHVRVGEKRFDGPARSIVVANGQYTGEGMRLSPRSWPGDGLLDILVLAGPRSDLFTLLPMIYRGDHLPNPGITELKGSRVEVDAERPLPVEADGIVLGTTPATFSLLRLALRLKIGG